MSYTLIGVLKLGIGNNTSSHAYLDFNCDVCCLKPQLTVFFSQLNQRNNNFIWREQILSNQNLSEVLWLHAYFRTSRLIMQFNSRNLALSLAV